MIYTIYYKIKADNQLYNKKLAKYKSLLSVDKKSSNRIKQIVNKRNNQLDYGRHLTTNRTVEMLLKANVEKVVIGWYKGIKSKINIGKKNNQNFVQIPFVKIIETLKYKVEAEEIVRIARENKKQGLGIKVN